MIGIAYALLLARGVRDGTGGGVRLDRGRAAPVQQRRGARGRLGYTILPSTCSSATWITREAVALDLPRLLILPCLLATFMVGPGRPWCSLSCCASRSRGQLGLSSMSGAGSLVDAAIAFVPHLFRQPALATYGVVLLALVPAGLLWSRLAHRTVNEESVAAKPTKFLLSIGMHAITLSWMFNFLRPEREHALSPMLAVWVVLLSSTWELGCIGWQAARGRESHFNHRTPVDSVIFMSMGIFATLLVAGNLPLAWEIACRPFEGADPVMTAAVIAGLLVSCLVGGGTGKLMGARNSHGIGREGRRLPLFGWSTVAGDVRPLALPEHPCAAGFAAPRRVDQDRGWRTVQRCSSR